MNLTQLKHKASKMKKKTRKGRGDGSGRGTYCGRGVKGYHSRSGSGRRMFAEGGQMPIYRRLPKRGFTNATFEKIDVSINVSELDRFDDGAKITLVELGAAGVVKGKFHRLRILGKGDVKKKFEVHAHHFTAAAKSKIEEAGGKCVQLAFRERRPKGVKKEKKTKEE